MLHACIVYSPIELYTGFWTPLLCTFGNLYLRLCRLSSTTVSTTITISTTIAPTAIPMPNPIVDVTVPMGTDGFARRIEEVGRSINNSEEVISTLISLLTMSAEGGGLGVDFTPDSTVDRTVPIIFVSSIEEVGRRVTISSEGIAVLESSILLLTMEAMGDGVGVDVSVRELVDI